MSLQRQIERRTHNQEQLAHSFCRRLQKLAPNLAISVWYGTRDGKIHIEVGTTPPTPSATLLRLAEKVGDIRRGGSRRDYIIAQIMLVA